MQWTIKLAPNRDNGGAGGSQDDLVLDLFSSAAKHFEPIDDDEDEELGDDPSDSVSPEAASDVVESAFPLDVPPAPVSGRSSRSGAAGIEKAASEANAPVQPTKRASSTSHWESLAAALGLETSAPEVSASTAPSDAGVGYLPPEDETQPVMVTPSTPDDHDDWKKTVADLFQIDPSEIPDRAPESDLVGAPDEVIDEDDDAIDFESDLDADFVEFEIKELSPRGDRRPASAGSDRPARPREQGQRRERNEGGRRRPSTGPSKPVRPAARTETARSSDEDFDQQTKSRSQSRDRSESERSEERRPASRSTESTRRGRPDSPRPRTARTSNSNVPASADMRHGEDDFIDPRDDASNGGASVPEAGSAIIGRNLSNRRRSSSSSTSRRPPRNDRRR